MCAYGLAVDPHVGAGSSSAPAGMEQTPGTVPRLLVSPLSLPCGVKDVIAMQEHHPLFITVHGLIVIFRDIHSWAFVLIL